MKLFIRTDQQTINNALQKSLPEFLHIYKDSTSEIILKEAYHSIRGSSTSHFTSQAPASLDTTQVDSIVTTSNERENKDKNLTEVIIKAKEPSKEKVKPSKEVKIATTKENQDTITSKSKKVDKKQLLLDLLIQGKELKEAMTILAEGGDGISEIYAKRVLSEYKKSKK